MAAIFLASFWTLLIFGTSIEKQEGFTSKSACDEAETVIQATKWLSVITICIEVK